jgi:hypothetical protein
VLVGHAPLEAVRRSRASCPTDVGSTKVGPANVGSTNVGPANVGPTRRRGLDPRPFCFYEAFKDF